jgi:hypothetical protein
MPKGLWSPPSWPSTRWGARRSGVLGGDVYRVEGGVTMMSAAVCGAAYFSLLPLLRGLGGCFTVDSRPAG